MTDQHRAFATQFFNEVWACLDKQRRSTEEDVQMIHLAHSSRAHWQMAGGPREWAIGEWQIARVYAALGRGEPALFHAELALEATADGAVGPFLAGCAQEVMARACRAAGRVGDAARFHAEAVRLAATLTDPEESDLLARDLAEGK